MSEILCKDCKAELPMHRLGCPEAKGETALYAKIEELQAKVEELEGMIRNGLKYTNLQRKYIQLQADLKAKELFGEFVRLNDV